MDVDPPNPQGGGGGGSGGGAGSNTPPPGAGGGSASGGGAGTFTPPPGQRLVSDADWNARDGFFTKAQALGFKDPGEFDQYGDLIGVMRTGKHDPKTFAQALSGKGAAGQQPPNQQTPPGAGGQKTDDERFKEWSSARDKQMAEQDHDKWFSEGLPQTRQKILDGLGIKDDTFLPEVLSELLDARIQKARLENPYPEGHALHGARAGRISEEQSTKIAGELKGMVEKFTGWRLGKIGKAANAPAGQSTPGGNAGGQGAPVDRGNGKPTDQDILELAGRLRGQLSGAQ